LGRRAIERRIRMPASGARERHRDDRAAALREKKLRRCTDERAMLAYRALRKRYRKDRGGRIETERFYEAAQPNRSVGLDKKTPREDDLPQLCDRIARPGTLQLLERA